MKINSMKSVGRLGKWVVLTLSASVLVACGGGGGGGPAEIPNANNLAPANVKLLEVSSAALGQITASWLPATDDATPTSNLKYQLHASTDAAFTPSSSTQVFEGQAVYQAVVTGLNADNKYFVKLLVVDSQNASTSSEALSTSVSNTTATLNSDVKVTTLGADQATIAGNRVTVQAGLSNVQVGQFIASAGNDNSGSYLKKVESVTTSNGATVLQTRDASVNEVLTDLKLSSTFRMDAVSSAVAEAAHQTGLVRVRSGEKNAPLSVNWENSGFRYSATPAESTSQKNVQLGLVKSTQKAEDTGNWGKITAPVKIALNENTNGQFNIDINITKAVKSGDSVVWNKELCKIEFGAIKGAGNGSKPEGITLKQGSWNIKQNANGHKIAATVPITVSAGAGVANAEPYKVEATLYVDAIGENCNGNETLAWWSDTAAVTLEIEVVNDSLPEAEKGRQKMVNANGSLTITNDFDVSFNPEIAFEKTVSSAKLTYAKVQLTANPKIIQTLTIDATGEANLEKTIDLIQPRTFAKIYVAGGVPILIKGKFKLQAQVVGKVNGALKATEELTIGYDKLSTGFIYQNGQYKTINEKNPIYKLKVAGQGDTTAEIELRLQPSLELTAYEVATGKVMLEPYVNSHAGVQGHVQLDAEVDPVTGLVSGANDADYRLTQADVSGGLRAFLFANLHVFDHSFWEWPRNATVDDRDSHQKFDLIVETKILSIPTLTPSEPSFIHKHPGDTRAVRLYTSAKNAENPLKLPSGYVIAWRSWALPKIVPQVGIDPTTYRFLPATGDDGGEVWAVFNKPGTYIVRQGGYSSLGAWARQYVETTIEIKDDNGNGISDWWEQRYNLTGGSGAAIATGDADGDGVTNLQEWELGSDPTVKAATTVITDVSPGAATEGQKTLFTVTGANLTDAISLSPSTGTCHKPYWVSSTQIKVLCAMLTNSNGSAPYLDVRNGSDTLHKRTVTLSGQLNCTVDEIDVAGQCRKLGTALRDTEAPTVMQNIAFSVSQWWEGVKNVLWSFSDGTASMLKSVVETVSVQFFTAGSKTVTATYKDANENILGSSKQEFVVTESDVSIQTNITGVFADNVSPRKTITDGTTTDNTPLVEGIISAALGSCGAVTDCYTVQVFDGHTSLGTAKVSGTQWNMLLPTLKDGGHALRAAVVRFDGAAGTKSALFDLTVTSGASSSTSKLPHSGITASQCYYAGSNTLMTCSGVASDLNGQQDGHRTSINAMSYSQVGSYPISSCVKDNVTGLIWEGKESSGTRSGSNSYTNYHSSYSGTQAQMDAATNTYGYVAAVNAIALCGFTDWRLPTVDELQTIVDYGRSNPSINTTWFPNMSSTRGYWSSTKYEGDNSSAWGVAFNFGGFGGGNRYSDLHIRLVRMSQ